MARGRLISKSLGSSRKFHALHGVPGKSGKLAEFTQALYPILVASSDDFGRQKGDAFTIKLVVFPSSPRSERDFDAALNAMHSVGLVTRYEVDGEIYIQINDFDAHQPNLHKRKSSYFPPPPEGAGSDLPGNSGSLPETPGDSGLARARRTLNSELRTLNSNTVTDVTASAFDSFWKHYPRKTAKRVAEASWRKLAPSPELAAQILTALEAHKLTEWRDRPPDKIPHAATWLNQRRFEDELGSDAPRGPSGDPFSVMPVCRACGACGGAHFPGEVCPADSSGRTAEAGA